MRSLLFIGYCKLIPYARGHQPQRADCRLALTRVSAVPALTPRPVGSLERSAAVINLSDERAALGARGCTCAHGVRLLRPAAASLLRWRWRRMLHGDLELGSSEPQSWLCRGQVTDLGGNAAVLGPELRHRLVPARDPQALVNAWGPAPEEPVRRAADGTAARGQVERDFSTRQMVRRYKDPCPGGQGVLAPRVSERRPTGMSVDSLGQR